MTDKKELPMGDPETFVGEFHNMDLSELADDIFAVAQSNGNPDWCQYICSTLRAPYTFYEMVEEVGIMWKDEQVHAKVIILDTNRENKLRWLDQCTIDFIEARYLDIISDGWLGGALDKDYDVRACILDEQTAMERINDDVEEIEPANNSLLEEDESHATTEENNQVAGDFYFKAVSDEDGDCVLMATKAFFDKNKCLSDAGDVVPQQLLPAGFAETCDSCYEYTGGTLQDATRILTDAGFIEHDDLLKAGQF